MTGFGSSSIPHLPRAGSNPVFIRRLFRGMAPSLPGSRKSIQTLSPASFTRGRPGTRPQSVTTRRQSMKCPICKHGETVPGKATVTLERGATTLVVKGVPAQVCENCGEEYVDENVVARLLSEAEESERAGTEVNVRLEGCTTEPPPIIQVRPAHTSLNYSPDCAKNDLRYFL